MSSINTSNINVDDNGSVTFSGISSSIDSAAIIDATIAARRFQAVQFEDAIVENTEQISAYQDLDTLTTALTSTLDVLRGSTSFFTDNAFDSKVASGSTSAAATAASGYSPSSADNLISAAVTSDAVEGTHTIQINQLAQANQIRSDAFTSKTDTLNSLGVSSGDFTVGTATITVDDDDTLTELSSKINAAGAGVSATIISASDTEHYLVLTAETTGAANAITFSDIGTAATISIDNAGFETDLPAVPSDGNFQVGVTDWSSTGGNLAAVNAATADFPAEEWEGEVIMTMTTGKTATQTLATTFDSTQNYQLDVQLGNRAPVGATSDYAIRIYAGATLVGETTGTSNLGTLDTVSLNIDGSAFSANDGEALRIEFANTSGGELAFDNVQLSTTSTATALGLTLANGDTKNELTAAQDANLTVDGITNVVRDTNEVDDIFEGVTLSLLQAEEDTEITLQIASDLNTVKTALTDFANAYNDLRDFVDEQREEYDRDEDGEEEFGVLAFDNTLRQIANRLGTVVGTENTSLTDGFQSLGQIGIELNSDFQLEIDDEILDNKLLTNVDSIRELFEVTLSTTDSRIQYIDRSTDTISGTYTLNIGATDADGNILSANINGPSDGSDDGSVTISGKTITATDATNADGLKFIFSGAANLGNQAGITLDLTRGIADTYYDTFDNYGKAAGELDTLIADLETQNTDAQERIDTIDARLEIARETLESQYLAMETALAQLESLREQISQFFDTGDDS